MCVSPDIISSWVSVGLEAVVYSRGRFHNCFSSPCASDPSARNLPGIMKHDSVFRVSWKAFFHVSHNHVIVCCITNYQYLVKYFIYQDVFSCEFFWWFKNKL